VRGEIAELGRGWGAVLALAAVALPASAARAETLFVDRAAETGLVFRHFNGMTGALYFPEMTGQGGALLDYDGDGDLDVYLVQGALLGARDTMADALFPYEGEGEPRDRLFRNDLAAAGRDLVPRFVDVTGASGLAATGYGMGVATGDVDGDGWVDLYVTNYGPNQLWRNNGDGTFSDWTERSGTGDPLWGTSASFFDWDGDGRLDLYVANYVEFDVERNPYCTAASSRRDYCGPSGFAPQPDRLYRNLGGGRFTEVSGEVLRGYAAGPGLGVVAADFNGDGRTDLFVANDGELNQLWLQQPDGTAVDEALFAGVAVNREGMPEASMGVAADDYDLDGDVDIFVTHLADESNTLYVNDGQGLFEDRTAESGLAAVSLPFTAFGIGWIDYDNDGRLDLLALNGAVRQLDDQLAAGEPYPLKQPGQLFRNLGGRFEDVSRQAGEALLEPDVGRGAAFGDIDQDGDVDVLVANSNGPARLLINRVGSRGAWTGAVLVDAEGGPAIGARLVLGAPAVPPRERRVHTDGSYCSASDPRLTVGLGRDGIADRAEIAWPGGGRRRLTALPASRYLVWRER